MSIYFDYAATTRVLPEAAQAAYECLTEGFGNPSSGYALGKQAADRLKADRAAVAGALGCAPGEVFFTSCGTEGDNWALRAARRAPAGQASDHLCGGARRCDGNCQSAGAGGILGHLAAARRRRAHLPRGRGRSGHRADSGGLPYAGEQRDRRRH